jgi:uncharacterized membrane protein (DUF2068 family)
MVRCVRCDAWLQVEAPEPSEARWARVPPLGDLDLPLRGRALRDRLVLRAIAIERGIHAAVFGLLALAVVVAQSRLPALQSAADNWLETLTRATSATARGESQSLLVEGLKRIANLSTDQLLPLGIVAGLYATVETLEAVFLWKGRRWAEYLTVVATAGFLAPEIVALTRGVSAVKLVVLAVNVVIVVWLVWHKRLFGLRGGARSLVVATDWPAVLARPAQPALRSMAGRDSPG